MYAFVNMSVYLASCIIITVSFLPMWIIVPIVRICRTAVSVWSCRPTRRIFPICWKSQWITIYLPWAGCTSRLGRLDCIRFVYCYLDRISSLYLVKDLYVIISFVDSKLYLFTWVVLFIHHVVNFWYSLFFKFRFQLCFSFGDLCHLGMRSQGAVILLLQRLPLQACSVALSLLLLLMSQRQLIRISALRKLLPVLNHNMEAVVTTLSINHHLLLIQPSLQRMHTMDVQQTYC
jgi:hypothetical protein